MSSRRSSGDTFLIPFGLIFLMAGLGVGILYFGLIWQWHAARSWVEVPCFIESSTLRDHLEVRPGSQRPVDTLMNEAMASYRYEFNGREYKSDQVSLSLGPDNFGDFHERKADVLREYQNSGQPYRCFVNPDDPKEAVIFREARWPVMLFMSVFPLVFPLVGGIVATMGLLGLLEKRRVKGWQQKYPGQPWRWNAAAGEEWIAPKNAGNLWGWVTVAVWMTLLWGPMIYALLVDGDVTLANPVSLVAIVLPGMFLSIVVWMTLKRLVFRKFGQMKLHVESLPVSPGRDLKADLAIPHHLHLPLHSQIRVEVRCVREVTTRSGKSTTTSREPIWSDEVFLPFSEAANEAAGRRLRVVLPIPAGLPAMPLSLAEAGWHDREQHVWELEVTSTQMTTPVIFDLPVFLTDEAVRETALESHEGRPAKDPLGLDADELTMHLARYHITAVFDSKEMPVSFDLDPRRFAKVRLFLILFNSVWTGAFLLMLLPDEIPGLFPLIWGASSALLWWVVISHLERKRLVFSEAGLEVSRAVGPWSRREVFERRHLVQFIHSTNMSSGSTRYYQVRAETIFGKKVTLLDGITSELVVENLCPLLERWRKQA